MSDFENRANTTELFIAQMDKFYWTSSIIKEELSIITQQYGYETHVTEKIQALLKHRYSKTAKFIRYVPDSILCNPSNEVLLEYKVTNTPRYTFQDKQWERGQIEADALENYIDLVDSGINVAIVIYCPYHPYPLLCGIPSRQWIYGNRQRTSHSSGSGTDFYNIDLKQVPHFEKFMLDFFKVPIDITKSLIYPMLKEMKQHPLLQTKHASCSIYNRKEYQTGFNWQID